MRAEKKEDINKTLGKVFKEYRVKNKLTQEKIAEKLGISVKYISRIENGTGGVKLETLVNYINILGISPNLIFEPLITNENVKQQIETANKLGTLKEEQSIVVQKLIEILIEQN